MLEAAGWGLVAASPLLIGALIGLWKKPADHVLAVIMAFGAGVLFSSVAFDLTEEAFRQGGADAVAIGLAAGALAFFAGDLIVDRRGRPGSRSDEDEPESPNATALGAILDGIPESVAIGITLVGGGGVSAAFVAAVFISNLPEGLSSAVEQKGADHKPRRIVFMWTVVILVSAVAAALGFGLLDGASGEVFGLIQAFAAGAILTMLCDSMIPKAFKRYEHNPVVGVVTALGFSAAFLLSTID